MEEERKIYIGNLDYEVKEDDLKQLFEEKGIEAKDVKIVTDKFTGRSKGFGFAEFEKTEEAQSAIESLDGQDLKGRTLRVNKARKQRPRFDRGDRFPKFNR